MSVSAALSTETDTPGICKEFYCFSLGIIVPILEFAKLVIQ